jgi:hypothetical protein
LRGLSFLSDTISQLSKTRHKKTITIIKRCAEKIPSFQRFFFIQVKLSIYSLQKYDDEKFMWLSFIQSDFLEICHKQQNE